MNAIIKRVWRQDKMVNVDVLNGFVFTGESDAHQFVISGKNGDAPVAITGSITANFKNAKGEIVPLTGAVEDGEAVVTLTNSCYAVEGPFSLTIFADTICIYAAIANVINSSGEVIAYPTASIPSIQELIEEAQDVIASIPQDYSTLNQSVQDLKSALIDYNAINLLSGKLNYESRTTQGVTYAWNNGVCTVTGTWNTSTVAASRLYNKANELPEGIEVGGTYYPIFETTSNAIALEICAYINGSLVSNPPLIRTAHSAYDAPKKFTIPANTTGLLIRLITVKKEELNATTSDVVVLPAWPQTWLTNKITEVAANNHTLTPTGDNTDRTDDIVQMLTTYGICHLVAGQYNVGTALNGIIHGVDMPEGSTLTGVGSDTVLLLNGSDADAGYAVRLNSRCMVSDLTIKGTSENHDNNSDTYPDTTYVNRHGVIWDGVFTSGSQLFPETTTTPAKAMLRNLWICNFSGGAITLNNTGTNVYRGITVSDCTIWYCYVGINIRYYSEFNKFCNIASTHCRFGVINNGGNNTFTNSNFSSNNVGFIINNLNGKSPNNGHGSVSNCTINHSGGDTGLGISLIDVTPGFVFEGCQLFYSGIRTQRSNGIIFTSLNVGWGPNVDGQHYGESINISDGSLIMFNGCGFRVAPQITVTNNNNVKFINCYTWDGTAVEP